MSEPEAILPDPQPVAAEEPSTPPSKKKASKPQPLPRLRVVNRWNQLINFNHGGEFLSLMPGQEIVVNAPASPAVNALARLGRVRVANVDDSDAK